MVSGSKDSESVEQFADALCEIEKKTDALRIKADDTLILMNSKHDEISKQVTTTVQQVKDKLDNLQSSFQKKFKQMHGNEYEKLAERKQKIEEFLKSVQKGQKSLNDVREHGSPKQTFITKEKLKVQLKQQIEGLKEDLAGAHCVEYVLNTECTVTSILNALTSVAEVAVNPTFDLFKGVSEVSGIVDFFNKNSEQHKQIDIMEIEVNKENSINPGGEITGGTLLPDGRFVICCWVHRNSKLRIYDTSGVCLFEKLCSDNNPKDACLIPPSGRCILVSVYDKNILQKYQIEQNTMKEIGTITCKPCPWGIAASKENIIVGYGSEIDVMSMTGMVIRSISRSGDHLSYVAVSLSGNVYYTDNNNIVCATSDGKEVRRFTRLEVNRLTGIAVDRYENMYVCGYNSNNVAVFSSDGQSSKILPTGIDKPFKPCLDSTETKLIITTSRGVHCYRLKNRV